MNHLLVKIKEKSNEHWKILSQANDFFKVPNLSNAHKFSPSYKLEDEEWHKLEKFSNLELKNEFIRSLVTNTTNHNQLPKNLYQKISYFCCKQANYVLFQKINPSQFLKKRWFSIGDSPILETEKPIIILHDYLDAIYDIKTDILYFRNIMRLEDIFKGIENLYREATQAEVTTFLQNDFIQLKDDFTINKIGKANRKRIAMFLDKCSALTPVQKTELIMYVKHYCPDISVIENNIFTINSDEQLKKLLYAIDERYYTTQMGKEKRLANSIQSLEVVATE